MRWWLLNGQIWASESLPLSPLVVCDTDRFIRWIEGTTTFDRTDIDVKRRRSLAVG